MKISRRTFLKGVGAVGLTAAATSSREAEAEVVAAIDVHAHMPLEKFGGPLAPRFARLADSNNPDAAALGKAVQGDTFDAIAALRIQDMRQWGVEQTVLMPIDFGYQTDNDTHWQECEAIAKIAAKHPAKFIPFLACDPRRSNANDLLRRAVKDLGVKGVKIHPLAGFPIDDIDAAYPFYKECASLNVPILGHCRPVGVGPRDDLSRPERYAHVARDFPKLKICLGHFGGGPWSQDALNVLEKYPNAYADISTLQSMAGDESETFGALMRRVMDGPGRRRIMYGTDWPTQRRHDAKFLDLLRKGIPKFRGGTYLDNDEIKLLLRENAIDFLALPPEEE